MNALALRAEEGRDKLRKVSGRSKYPLIRECPNGETHLSKPQVSSCEYIATRGKSWWRRRIVEWYGKINRRKWKSCKRNLTESDLERVAWDTRNPVWIWGDHPLRLNTTQWPIENSTVRERWKEPREGSEIEPETLYVQADRVLREMISYFL